MRIYATIIEAIDPLTGDLETWNGDNVHGISVEDAQNWCIKNGKGYLKVIGELICEIPCDEEFKADFDNKVDYDNYLN